MKLIAVLLMAGSLFAADEPKKIEKKVEIEDKLRVSEIVKELYLRAARLNSLMTPEIKAAQQAFNEQNDLVMKTKADMDKKYDCEFGVGDYSCTPKKETPKADAAIKK